MRSMAKLILSLFLTLPLLAQESKELDEALQNFMLLLQKTQQSLQELSQLHQKAIPEEKSGFILFYKKLHNSAKVVKRSDLLIKTQIEYQLLKDKELPSSQILVLVQDGSVEFYGKVYDKKSALKILNIALHTRGVKEATSYLIIKERAKILL